MNCGVSAQLTLARRMREVILAGDGDMSTQRSESATTHEPLAGEKRSGLQGWLREILKPEDRDHLLEIIAVVLLSLTTIISAWCAYQATRWSGVQAIAFSQASAERIESVRFSNQANQLIVIDIGLFTQYATAVSEGNTQLADFLHARFRPEFVVAYNAWIATSPLTNPDAPKTPFEMKQYVVAPAVQSQQLEQKADANTQKATKANQTSDEYVLLVVIFALVLFFAGTSGKFRSMRLRQLTLGFAVVVFAVALVVVLTFPKY
jgi:hypothetical protein